MISVLSHSDLPIDLFTSRWGIRVVLSAHLVDIILVFGLDAVVTGGRVEEQLGNALRILAGVECGLVGAIRVSIHVELFRQNVFDAVNEVCDPLKHDFVRFLRRFEPVGALDSGVSTPTAVVEENDEELFGQSLEHHEVAQRVLEVAMSHEKNWLPRVAKNEVTRLKWLSFRLKVDPVSLERFNWQTCQLQNACLDFFELLLKLDTLVNIKNIEVSKFRSLSLSTLDYLRLCPSPRELLVANTWCLVRRLSQAIV